MKKEDFEELKLRYKLAPSEGIDADFDFANKSGWLVEKIKEGYLVKGSIDRGPDGAFELWSMIHSLVFFNFAVVRTKNNEGIVCEVISLMDSNDSGFYLRVELTYQSNDFDS